MVNRKQRKELKARLKEEMLQQRQEETPRSYEQSVQRLVYITNLLSLITFIPLLFIFLVVCFKVLQVVVKLDIVSMLTK